jgi:fructose-1,6-bisphosphatase/inositol monophosphatase family enzyme
MTDELYVAVSGHGAYRNGVRLRKQQTVKRMVDAVVGFEFGYARGKEKSDKMLAALGRIMENGCRTTRSLGSGVLDLVYVATGRLVRLRLTERSPFYVFSQPLRYRTLFIQV